MLIGNVPPTAWDLNFSLFRIPVRVHPLFWLVSLLLGPHAPPQLVIWVPVVFVSILVHEMGHALMIRQFGWWPSILLYTFGGLAIYQATHRDPRKQMLISFAGPLAGFCLAAAVVIALRAAGHPLTFRSGGPFGFQIEREGFKNVNLDLLVDFLLFVNIAWGLINLLPVYPLDGGQFLYALLDSVRVPDALVKSLWVSIVTATAVAIYAVARMHDFYLAAMFGYLAFTSFQTLQAHSSRGGGYGRW